MSADSTGETVDDGLDAERVAAVTFDSYSTLVDVTAAERALAARVDDPTAVSALWRNRSLAYTFVGNHVDAYEPFYEVNRDALTYALEATGADVSEVERDEILAIYHELDVFEDVREGLARIRDGGYDCHVLSNGNPEMLESMVAHADIGDLVEDTISADEIGIFKPDSALYRHAAARTETPVEELVHVSAAWFDVMGARHAGMQAVWLNRMDGPWEPFDGEPHLEVDGIDEFADALGV